MLDDYPLTRRQLMHNVLIDSSGKGIRVMNKMILTWLVVLAGCEVGDDRQGEQMSELAFVDGIPDPGSTWVRDPATGWGLLVGGVNFPVPYQIGSTLRGSDIRDNANSCMYCADGNVVAMMYVAYRGTSWEVIGETQSASDGTQRFYTIQLTRAVEPDEQLVVRFATLFVFPRGQPRTSLIQPPILL